jgi:RNA polymerase sigma factor (sigma-70 family)
MNVLTSTVTDMNDLTVRPSSQGITELPVVDLPGDERGYVYAVARRIVGSADDAEDVTQDTLVLAYRHRNAFRGDSRYRTWLHRIAVTTALGYLRRQRRLRIGAFDANHERVLARSVDPAKSPVALIAEAEARATVQRALAELPTSYRDVLLERVDATVPEVARRLGISVANVKVRAHRARKQLRQTLDRMERSAA